MKVEQGVSQLHSDQQQSWLKVNGANIMTGARLFCLPFSLPLIFVLGREHLGWYWIGTLIMVIGMVLDGLDGWYARKYQVASCFGQWFDSFVDKLFIWPHIIAVTLVCNPPFIQVWIVLIGFLAYFDYLSNSKHYRNYRRDRDQPFDPGHGANLWGKTKFVLQNVLVCGYVAGLAPRQDGGAWHYIASNVIKLIGETLSQGSYLFLLGALTCASRSLWKRRGD